MATRTGGRERERKGERESRREERREGGTLTSIQTAGEIPGAPLETRIAA
jgi:hypothetical protein